MNTQDSLIVVASLVLFPLFMGTLGSLYTLMVTKDRKKSLSEGIRITLVFWVVMVLGALVYALAS